MIKTSAGVVVGTNVSLPPASVGRFMRLKAVCSETGLPPSTLYLRISEGTFPKPIRLGGPRAVAWVESEVQAWKAQRLAERNSVAA